ncbi:MAG: phosphate acyltransferase PlsX [Eubacteriaceae bacterium]|nr:phosphate acyltransferase PlsX [Eubacteriaceae bacterium]
MNIYVDGMGGDNAPYEIVKGAVMAAKDFNKKIHIIGPTDIINDELKKYEFESGLIEVVNATEVITNDDEPTKVIRRKKDSSMIVGINRVKEDNESIFISAGSTGALLAAGTLMVGRIKGIQRPALTVMLPSRRGITLLLDVGANVDCKASYLVQFGQMASIYAEEVLGIKNPRVGIINIGTEEGKGNELTKEASGLLKEANINFVGNIESRDLVEGYADVIVCDGFTGNIMLKLIEGLSAYIFDNLKTAMTSDTRSKIGAVMLKPALKSFKKKFDYKETGGAPLLGVKAGIIKAHGSSDHRAFYNAIKQGIIFSEKNILRLISNKIVEI